MAGPEGLSRAVHEREQASTNLQQTQARERYIILLRTIVGEIFPLDATGICLN